MRCDERVFRCAPIYAIVLRVLRASLASSRSQLTQHLQANPRLDAHGQLLNEPDREEMCRAAIAAQVRSCTIYIVLYKTAFEVCTYLVFFIYKSDLIRSIKSVLYKYIICITLVLFLVKIG